MDKSVIQRIQDLLNENHSLLRSVPKNNISIALGADEQDSVAKEFVNLTGTPFLPGTKITKVMGYNVIDVQKESYLGLTIEEVAK